MRCSIWQLIHGYLPHGERRIGDDALVLNGNYGVTHAMNELVLACVLPKKVVIVRVAT